MRGKGGPGPPPDPLLKSSPRICISILMGQKGHPAAKRLLLKKAIPDY